MEVVSVLVLIGVISVIAISKANSIKQVELHTFASELKASLRFVQSNAMTTQSICAVVFNGSAYKYQDGNNTDQVLPGQNQVSITAPSSVNIATTSAFISFDTWGRPGIDPAKTDTNGDGLLDVSAGSTITISNSDEAITLLVTQETGYIKTQ